MQALLLALTKPCTTCATGTKRTSNPLTSGLNALSFHAHRFNFGGDRLRLTQAAFAMYTSGRRQQVQREREAIDATEHERERNGQARPGGEAEDAAEPAIDVSDVATDAAGGAAAQETLCAVCLDAPRSALVMPCGHTSTCMDCAKKLEPPLCVTCRSKITKVLPWSDL